ncbi:MAG: hypothetical protein NFW05_10840, partial [Candidatus Accumulibacter sp.]|nr:hypothetical protein [Accumulibacter sp.]
MLNVRRLLGLLRLSLLLVMPGLFSGCATIGAGSINRDRLDYVEALASSWKESSPKFAVNSVGRFDDDG